MVVTWSHDSARLTSKTVGKQLSFWHRCSFIDLPVGALLSAISTLSSPSSLKHFSGQTKTGTLTATETEHTILIINKICPHM